MTAQIAPCFHCGEPIPAGTHFAAHVGGAMQPVCCVGCHAAAEWIAALGLQDYYRLRDVPAERAAAREDYSAWDRPQLQRMYVRERDDGGAEVCVLVPGLRCAACSWLIDRALRELPGGVDVAVNVAAKRVQLVWRPTEIALSVLLERLACLGYAPLPLCAASLDGLHRQEGRSALKRLIVAGLGMMQSMMYAVALYAGAFEGMDPLTRDFFRWLGLLVSTPVVLYAGSSFFIGAWREWHARHLGMDTPVALAIALVFTASIVETVRGGAQVYFDSASMFVFLLLSARYVEMYARRRAADVVDALARLQPAIAQRRHAGGVETVGTHELQAGDIVVVDVGASIPADGVLLGTCEVDESLLSGESTPRRRRAGETLIAGTILRSGPVDLRVVHVGAQTVLSSIVRLVAQAQQQRPRWTRFGDALAARFIAGVLMLTVLVTAAWLLIEPAKAFPAALAILVVSCPCAFALSAPAATTRAFAVLARSGVLVLKPDALERLLALTHVVFDKTGTLTTQRMELVASQALGPLSADECLGIAAALESASSHPIALAIAAGAERLGVPAAEGVRSLTAAGIAGRVDGHSYRIGRAAFALGHEADDSDEGVLLADENGALARFAFREHLRSDAQATLGALRSEGLSVEILSGDGLREVADLARRLDAPLFRARVSPQEKLAHLQELRAQGGVVAMVGDGVNDAPVLAGADVAIALGDGAQLAQSSADIVLTGERLGALLDARRVARLTMRVLRQNTCWAIVYNFVSIPLAAVGLVPPWLAAIGMSASSLLVVLNSLRFRERGGAPPPAATTIAHVDAEVAPA